MERRTCNETCKGGYACCVFWSHKRHLCDLKACHDCFWASVGPTYGYKRPASQ